MTIPEAAQLVLQAGALAESGNIYVLDMGEPVKIMDLAKQLIRFYGYEPGVNMEIKIVGLRPGEKLYEELMMDEEQDKMRRTQHNKIFVASPRSIDLAEFYEQLQELAAAAEHNDEGVVQQLAKMIPTFTPHPPESEAVNSPSLLRRQHPSKRELVRAAKPPFEKDFPRPDRFSLRRGKCHHR